MKLTTEVKFLGKVVQPGIYRPMTDITKGYSVVLFGNGVRVQTSAVEDYLLVNGSGFIATRNSIYYVSK
jgi:hypothetical protein